MAFESEFGKTDSFRTCAIFGAYNFLDKSSFPVNGKAIRGL
jgi:hypothetical protein